MLVVGGLGAGGRTPSGCDPGSTLVVVSGWFVRAVSALLCVWCGVVWCGVKKVCAIAALL